MLKYPLQTVNDAGPFSGQTMGFCAYFDGPRFWGTLRASRPNMRAYSAGTPKHLAS